MTKLLFAILVTLFLSSCAFYELKPGEYNVDECECTVKVDKFEKFMKRDD